MHSIKKFQEATRTWNLEVFGNIFKLMRRTLARIEGIQKSLLDKYDNLLIAEKEFWLIKSRIAWLCEGDANTSFFYTTTLTRRRKNRIVSLESDSGETFDISDAIHKYTGSFFSKLYTTEQAFSTNRLTVNYQKVDSCVLFQDRPLIDMEIIQAVKSFKPLKAPGSDDLHPLFYQKY